LFLINPTAEAERARVDLGFPAALTDLLDGSQHDCRQDRLTVTLVARSVRMLKIDLA
jgi:hypothetical protein